MRCVRDMRDKRAELLSVNILSQMSANNTVFSQSVFTSDRRGGPIPKFESRAVRWRRQRLGLESDLPPERVRGNGTKPRQIAEPLPEMWNLAR